MKKLKNIDISISYIWDSILRHPIISTFSFIVTTGLSGFSFWFTFLEIKSNLGEEHFWRYTSYIVLVIAVVSLFLYSWSKIATYLFYNDYTKAVSKYMSSASKHDVWHLSKATKEYRRVLMPESSSTYDYRCKVLENTYKSFSTLTKHTFGDIFNDLEEVLSKSLYTSLKISLRLFPKDFDMNKLNSFQDLAELQYSEFFVEDGRMNLRDSVRCPLSEDMKALMFSKNLTHIYKIKDGNTGIIFILTAKSFSEFPKIYGFLDFSWKNLSRPFMDKEFLIDFIIPIILERVNILCYYISSMETYMYTLPSRIFDNPQAIVPIVTEFDFLKTLYDKYNE